MKLYDFLQLTQMDNTQVDICKDGKKLTGYKILIFLNKDIKNIFDKDDKLIIEV